MRTQLNLADGDGFYERLLDAHQNLSREQSEAFNARLILLLANQIGDAAVLEQCIEAAHSTASAVAPTETGPAAARQP